MSHGGEIGERNEINCVSWREKRLKIKKRKRKAESGSESERLHKFKMKKGQLRRLCRHNCYNDISEEKRKKSSIRMFVFRKNLEGNLKH